MDPVEEAAIRITESLKAGHKLLLFGNGGSAAESQHIAAEFIGHNPPLAALALTTDTSALTAIGNDYGFEQIFERQVRALAKEGDVVVGISTSWKSENVIRGMIAAKHIGAYTIALAGSQRFTIVVHAINLTINVDSENTQEIQEEHTRIGHRLFTLVSKSLK